MIGQPIGVTENWKIVWHGKSIHVVSEVKCESRSWSKTIFLQLVDRRKPLCLRSCRISGTQLPTNWHTRFHLLVIVFRQVWWTLLWDEKDGAQSRELICSREQHCYSLVLELESMSGTFFQNWGIPLKWITIQFSCHSDKTEEAAQLPIPLGGWNKTNFRRWGRINVLPGI